MTNTENLLEEQIWLLKAKLYERTLWWIHEIITNTQIE